MLLELKVQNLAIIEFVEIKFGHGLNVFTGETGAGKSVLLAALNLVLGERSDKELIRTGKQEAWAEALFESDEKIAPILAEHGIPFEANEPLSIRRTIQSNGRSRAYINSASVPASILKEIAPFLLDFGHQHEQSVLLNPEKHLELLDKYGFLEKQRELVSKTYNQVKSMISEYEKLENECSNRHEKLEFLSFQRKTISDVDIQPNEEQELTLELKKMSVMDECKKLSLRSESALVGSSDSIRESLAHAISITRELVSREIGRAHV